MFNTVHHIWLDLPTDLILVISLCCSICIVVPLHFHNCTGPSELFLLEPMNGKWLLCLSVLAYHYFSPDLFLELTCTVRHVGSLYFFSIPTMLCCIFRCWLLLVILPIFCPRVFQSSSKSLQIPAYLLPSVAFTVPFSFSLIYQMTEDLVCWILRH